MNHKVLVIEDDAGMRDSLRELLSSGDLQCSVAENGVQGLRIARAEHSSLVVMDMQLPDMSGYQLCQTLKKDPDLHDVAVVMISGRFTELDDRLQSFASGADEHFAKPFDPAVFMSRINRILQRAEPAVN